MLTFLLPFIFVLFPVPWFLASFPGSGGTREGNCSLPKLTSQLLNYVAKSTNVNVSFTFHFCAISSTMVLSLVPRLWRNKRRKLFASKTDFTDASIEGLRTRVV